MYLRSSLLAAGLLVGLTACPAAEPEPGPSGPFHDPSTVQLSSALPELRGLRTLRGIIHAHSGYSHDGCDRIPYVNGQPDETCQQELRAALCDTGQDFIFMTDHADNMADFSFVEALLFRAGDRLIERGGVPVANRIPCADGREVVLSAGTETGMMPIGLERHVGDTPQARRAAYGEVSVEAARALQAAGALITLQHTESWSHDAIEALPVDAIEIYNLHQNLMDNQGEVAVMLLNMVVEPQYLPIPELALLTMFDENTADMERWARAVGRGDRLAGFLATDIHRNTFNDETYDGERLDSFRRILHWFSNHLLIEPGVEIDDRVLKQAIAAGRLYGAFEYLGYPIGLDFHVRRDGNSFELGDEVPAGGAATLALRLPEVDRLDPGGPAPAIRGVVLRAQGDAWVEVASGDQNLELSVDPGVYRAEVHMVPHHLTPWLGRDPVPFLNERVWIYTNPIHVR